MDEIGEVLVLANLSAMDHAKIYSSLVLEHPSRFFKLLIIPTILLSCISSNAKLSNISSIPEVHVQPCLGGTCVSCVCIFSYIKGSLCRKNVKNIYTKDIIIFCLYLRVLSLGISFLSMFHYYLFTWVQLTLTGVSQL